MNWKLREREIFSSNVWNLELLENCSKEDRINLRSFSIVGLSLRSNPLFQRNEFRILSENSCKLVQFLRKTSKTDVKVSRGSLLAHLFEIDRFKRETRPRVFEARKVNPSTSKLSSLRICRFWKEAISSYAFIVKSDTIGSLLASFGWRHEREIHQLLQATSPR